MRNLVFLTVLLGALFTSGCMWRKGKVAQAAAATKPAVASPSTHAPGAGQKPTVTPENGLNGTVASAKASLRFVVLTFPVDRMPAMDQRLSVYRQGLKVGEVKITGPLRDDNIVADIVAGEAEKGDEVRER